jgi:hypothetical protein
MKKRISLTFFLFQAMALAAEPMISLDKIAQVTQTLESQGISLSAEDHAALLDAIDLVEHPERLDKLFEKVIE